MHEHGDGERLLHDPERRAPHRGRQVERPGGVVEVDRLLIVAETE